MTQRLDHLAKFLSVDGAVDSEKATLLNPANTQRRRDFSSASGNVQVAPRNRVSYQINAQAPQYDLHSLDDLRNLPILGSTSGQAQIVANVALLSRTTTSPVEDHYNIRPVINIYGGAEGKDLGYVSDQIQKLVDASRKDLPRGSFISVRGQVNTMHDSYTGCMSAWRFPCCLLTC
jgi:multidrug efflux pump subunit AcrB